MALNKCDINEKKNTTIHVDLLAEKLGCPVVETVSTHARGLDKLVEIAVAQIGKTQKVPYEQGTVDLTDQSAVQVADRARFAFVNDIVSRVEKRKVLTRSRSIDDQIDAVLTNQWVGIPIFVVVMFFVFQISQVWVGPYVADTLVALLEGVQSAVGEAVSGSSDFLQALLIDGMIGGVIAVIGFLPLVMVMYFLIALLEDCGYMACVSVVLDPIFKVAYLVYQIGTFVTTGMVGAGFQSGLLAVTAMTGTVLVLIRRTDRESVSVKGA